MTDQPRSRRSFLGGLGGIGALALAGPIRPKTTTDEDAGMTSLGDRTGLAASCTPGSTPGTEACRQIRNDREVLTRIDLAGTAFRTTFAYPCGWVTALNEYEDRLQANVTRTGIGEEDAYVDVQVRNYTDPVDEGLLDSIRQDGDFDDVDYQYDGVTRTGLLSTADTAQFGTTAHALVPSKGVDGLVHVELVSTLKGADCPQPQPDYLLVKEMLASLEPNFAGPGYPQASVTLEDQQVSGDVATQSVVVDRVDLSTGGYVSIVDGSVEDGVDGVIGASSYLSEGQHENVRIALDTTLTSARTVAAVAHRDTDGDNVYEFGESTDVDIPYRDSDGTPVYDRAAIDVLEDTPVESRSPTPTPTTTFSPTPTTTPTPTPTTTLTPTPSPTPTTRLGTILGSDTSTPASTTEGGGPGFGFGIAVGGLGVASVILLSRHLQDGGE